MANQTGYLAVFVLKYAGFLWNMGSESRAELKREELMWGEELSAAPSALSDLSVPTLKSFPCPFLTLSLYRFFSVLMSVLYLYL